MNKFRYNQKPYSEGFTLIELLVALSLFTIVMTIAVGSLFTIVSANKRARAIQITMDNLHFALDEMVRDIRTGTEYSYNNSGNGCGDPFTFSFTASDGSDVSYRRCSNGRLQKDGGDGWVNVTAPEIDVSTFRLYDRNTTQPQALIVIGGTAEADGNVTTEFNLQTTVSQRKLNLN